MQDVVALDASVVVGATNGAGLRASTRYHKYRGARETQARRYPYLTQKTVRGSIMEGVAKGSAKEEANSSRMNWVTSGQRALLAVGLERRNLSERRVCAAQRE